MAADSGRTEPEAQATVQEAVARLAEALVSSDTSRAQERLYPIDARDRGRAGC